MRSFAAISALAFAASVRAQVAGFAVISAPGEGEKVPAGSAYKISWNSGDYTGPVAISILQGQTPTTLQPGATIAGGIPVTANEFNWNVDCSLGKEATYGIKIASEGDASLFQYSFPFSIDNSACEGNNQGGDGGYTTEAPPSSTEGGSYPTGTPPVESTSEESQPPAYPTTAPPAESSTTKTEAPSTSAPPPEYPTSAPPAESSSTSEAQPPSSAYPTNTPPAVTNTPEYPTGAPSSSTTFGTGYPTNAPSVTPTPTGIPVAGAGRNAAGSLAAIVGFGAAMLAL